MTRWYLSGPISAPTPAEVERNKQVFRDSARVMRGRGLRVCNPVEICPQTGLSWGDYMRKDLSELLKCDAVALLPGWQDSKGACLERHVAEQLGMRVCRVGDLVGVVA